MAAIDRLAGLAGPGADTHLYFIIMLASDHYCHIRHAAAPAGRPADCRGCLTRPRPRHRNNNGDGVGGGRRTTHRMFLSVRPRSTDSLKCREKITFIFVAVAAFSGLFRLLVAPILWGHSGPLCHALSLFSLLRTSMRRRRATVATPGEWQCKIRTGGVRRLAVANGRNIFFKCFLLFFSVCQANKKLYVNGFPA